MASLAELLAEDGFKKGKPNGRLRGPAASRAVSMPLHPDRLRNPAFHHGDSRVGPGRTRSNAFSRRSQSMMVGKSSSLVDVSDGSREMEEFNNGLQESREPRGRNSENFRKIDSYKEKHSNDSYEGRKFRGGPSFNAGSRGRKHGGGDPENTGSVLELDKAAVRALVSMLTGYTKRFFKDESFRASVYRSCASCLGIGGGKDGCSENTGVVANLKEAIGTIERVIDGSPNSSSRELRKASVKLSVITGLSSAGLKDGFTSGIPNSSLAACAHLYLSVIYKLQKKDRVSAKHVLQVFCDAPNPARTALLTGLWDRLFHPHLSHLSEWYRKEARSVGGVETRMRKMKLLDEVYNSILDMGTFQFAVYYREWLMEESGGPELPSIIIPCASFPGNSGESPRVLGSNDVSSPAGSASSQAMVSRRLYESVFGQPKKMDQADDMEGWEEEENEEMVVEEEQFTIQKGSSTYLIQEDEETATCSSRSETHMEEHLLEDYSISSSDPDANSDVLQMDEWTNGVKELTVSKDHQSLPPIQGDICAPNLVPQEKDNKPALNRLAQADFQPHVLDHSIDAADADAGSPDHTLCLPEYDLHQYNYLNDAIYTKSQLQKSGIMSSNFAINQSVLGSSAESFGNFEDIDQNSFFSSIPEDFICPLTGQLFKDPVTLESGQTYERAAIKEWFDRGNKVCPVTRRELESLAVPVTNFVLRRVIDGWKSEQCRNLLFLATQIAGDISMPENKSKGESALFIIKQLLNGFSIEEQMENAKYFVSLGGLEFLVRRFELGNLEEKTRVAALMLCCIKADGRCRSYLAVNIGRPSMLELLHSKQINARASAVSLLIELICLHRRMAITSLLSGLHLEAIVNTMHVLLVYLQSSAPKEKVLIAVLLLHFDLMVESRRYSIYREEAVDSIALALDCCSCDKEVIPNSCRALLMLGGHFSFSGEMLTEIWLLKQAGLYHDSYTPSNIHDDEEGEVEEEEEAYEREEWMKNMTLVLLGNGKRSFLDAISECLGSGNPELVEVCLATVAWLSHALALLPVAEFQLSAFSTLIPRLKESLDNSQHIKHRVLASLALLNFSKISECRVVLMTFSEEMLNSLRSLMEVTWTAKHLYAAICGEDQEFYGQE